MLGKAVAYGWVATRRAEIGEMDLSFVIPQCDRYLWDFGTVPAWRGQGIYPRLLQSIVARESEKAQRFWIISAPENAASALGIQRAGFRPVAELSFLKSSRPALRAYGPTEHVEAASHLLRVPIALDSLSACWRCGPGCEGACTCADQPNRGRPRS
jgi:GNAT superfamily N-acetyltransferase